MELITGSTGDGKTMQLMLRAFTHLDRGGVFGCNFHFKPGWAWRMAARSYDHKVEGKPLEEVARCFWQRAFLCGKTESIVQLANVGRRYVVGPVAKQFDKQVMLGLDEGQLYMGPDKYRDNMPWLQLFTQSRKLKLDCVILAHDVSYIDTKVRKLLKVISVSMNLAEHWRIPGTDIGWPRGDKWPWLPRPSFILKRYSPLVKKVHFRFAKYQPWITECYDTDELFDFDNLPSALESQGCLGENPFAVAAAAEAAKKRPSWPQPEREADGSYTLYARCLEGA